MAQSTDNQASPAAFGMAVATGGTNQQVNDVLWVIYKRKSEYPTRDKKLQEFLKKETNGDRMTLALYQVTAAGRQLRFLGAREITFDFAITDWVNNDSRASTNDKWNPPVKEMQKFVDELMKELEKDKEKDKSKTPP